MVSCQQVRRRKRSLSQEQRSHRTRHTQSLSRVLQQQIWPSLPISDLLAPCSPLSSIQSAESFTLEKRDKSRVFFSHSQSLFLLHNSHVGHSWMTFNLIGCPVLPSGMSGAGEDRQVRNKGEGNDQAA